MSDDWLPVIPPPAIPTVDDLVRKPVLYKPDGTPLVKRPAGFDTSRIDTRKKSQPRD